MVILDREDRLGLKVLYGDTEATTFSVTLKSFNVIAFPEGVNA